VVVSLTGILASCARIMGVEEATLVPPSAEAGADAATLEDAGIPPDACVGAGCPCTDRCLDPRYAKCVDGRCAECTVTPDSCGLGRFCVGGTPGAAPDSGLSTVNECAPGCSSDEACAALTSAPFCDVARHQCVACRRDDECTAGGLNRGCTAAGVCADRCTEDGGTCPDLVSKCCGGFCVDTAADPFNCSGCGAACAAGDVCCNSACRNPLTSVDSCGGCGRPCSSVNGIPACTAGTCKWTCNAGFGHCAGDVNSGCETNVATNLLQCGSCTTSCVATVANATGVECAGGQCGFASCNPGFADCDRKPENGCECTCGRRDEVCCGGATCEGSLSCVEGRCRDCGAKDKSCCPGGTCVAATRCREGKCRSCLPADSSCSDSDECCSDECRSVGGSGQKRCK
jgi:hypothetical protein